MQGLEPKVRAVRVDVERVARDFRNVDRVLQSQMLRGQVVVSQLRQPPAASRLSSFW